MTSIFLTFVSLHLPLYCLLYFLDPSPQYEALSRLAFVLFSDTVYLAVIIKPWIPKLFIQSFCIALTFNLFIFFSSILSCAINNLYLNSFNLHSPVKSTISPLPFYWYNHYSHPHFPPTFTKPLIPQFYQLS